MPKTGGVAARMDAISESFKEHAKQDEKGFDGIHETLTVMKENHLAHIEKATAKQATDIEWLKKIMWLFLVPIVGGFVGIVYQIMSS